MCLSGCLTCGGLCDRLLDLVSGSFQAQWFRVCPQSGEISAWAWKEQPGSRCKTWNPVGIPRPQLYESSFFTARARWILSLYVMGGPSTQTTRPWPCPQIHQSSWLLVQFPGLLLPVKDIYSCCPFHLRLLSHLLVKSGFLQSSTPVSVPQV